MVEINKKDLENALKQLLGKVPKDVQLKALNLPFFAQLDVASTKTVLIPIVEKFADSHPEEARFFRARVVDGLSNQEIANLGYIEGLHKANRMWQKVVTLLVDGIVEDIRSKQHKKKEKQLLRLEAQNYDQLFGFDNLIADTGRLLVDENAPWVVALSGLGGAGKTSIADAITRKVIEESIFDDIVWIRAAPQDMGNADREKPAISDQDLIREIAKVIGSPTRSKDFASEERLVKSTFNDKRMLLILDNLETLRDINSVLKLLKHLANPSKVLITAREFPIELSVMGVRRVAVNELGFDDANAVLRNHAGVVGGDALKTIIQSHSEEIFEGVGGSPHALRLVVSLATQLPVTAILQDLPNWNLQEIDKLYRYIYYRVWNVLTEPLQDFLLAFATISEDGETLDRISRISGVGDDSTNIVQELNKYSLLEQRGNYQEIRYAVHSLTKTFLRNDIGGW